MRRVLRNIVRVISSIKCSVLRLHYFSREPNLPKVATACLFPVPPLNVSLEHFVLLKHR